MKARCFAFAGRHGAVKISESNHTSGLIVRPVRFLEFLGQIGFVIRPICSLELRPHLGAPWGSTFTEVFLQ